MKFSLSVAPFGPFADARTLAQLASQAEQAGWDAFIIWDHITWEGFPSGITDTQVALTAIALHTERIRFGALVTPLPRRRPWKVARETAALDRLSGGRLVFGVGIGGSPAEFDQLGEETDLKTRGQMLDEALEVLTGLWSGEEFQYEGKYYQLEAAHFMPTPVQQPRIPVFVAGVWPNKAPLARAARWDGLFPLIMADNLDEEVEALRQAVAYVRQQRSNDAPFEVVHTHGPLGDDRAQAMETLNRFEEAGATWWQLDVSPFGFGTDMLGDWPEAAMRAAILKGPPTRW